MFLDIMETLAEQYIMIFPFNVSMSLSITSQNGKNVYSGVYWFLWDLILGKKWRKKKEERNSESGMAMT
jgi:hypothetical protein